MRNIQANQEGLKLNGTHHLLVCGDDVNLLYEIQTREVGDKGKSIAVRGVWVAWL
jgi:hypothetical protein